MKLANSFEVTERRAMRDEKNFYFDVYDAETNLAVCHSVDRKVARARAKGPRVDDELEEAIALARYAGGQRIRTSPEYKKATAR